MNVDFTSGFTQRRKGSKGAKGDSVFASLLPLRLCVKLLLFISLLGCSKSHNDPPPVPPVPPAPFSMNSVIVEGIENAGIYSNLSTSPVTRIRFSAPVKSSSIPTSVTFTNQAGTAVPFNHSLSNGDSVMLITPSSPLPWLSKFTVNVSMSLRSKQEAALTSPVTVNLFTRLDSSDKFPRISDDELLTLVQRQTFKYFWDFAHPVSGLARERNTSGDVVTSGGSGFGIMAIVTGISRNFITRAEGLARLQKIVSFLKNDADTFHGAFPHWLNGVTGSVVPFSQKDNGADLVETSYLMQGLLTARQFFNGGDAAETTLRNDINSIWNAVDWNWFRNGGQQVLYWHWSPTYNFEMNIPIRGWNESLITYLLAASSTNPIPKSAYDQGWASSGLMKNNNIFYGIELPLGPPLGGPLFFAHYSFLGLNPDGLTDAYANYFTQNRNHTLINYNYAVANPRGFNGYSDSVWGLTASDIPGGYDASSPTNDLGVIAPTAALSSFPYTPIESMKALKFFYYKLGDKIWKEYGFVDAFSLHEPWFATSFLAIDQGPIIIMIENHRTGLLWDLFMSAPEIKNGLMHLGFNSPHI